MGFFVRLFCGVKSLLYLCIMNNTQHIQDNYKRSTMGRLMERFNYNNETEIDADMDITSLLSFLEQQRLQTQDTFFDLLDVMKKKDK